MRILIVDDQEDQRTLLLNMARDLAHEVRGAASMREAQSELAKSPSDAILINVELEPERFLEALREQPGYAYVAVYSAPGPEQERRVTAAYEAGCDGDLRRPIGHQSLYARLKAVERLLDLAGDERPTLPEPPPEEPEETPLGELTETSAEEAQAALDTIAATKAWQDVLPTLATVTGGFFMVDMVADEAQVDMRDARVARGIVLTNVLAQAEIRLALVVDAENASSLTVHMFLEENEALWEDMLGEVANMSMGALKSAFSSEEIAFTGGLPVAVHPQKLERFTGECAHVKEFTLACPHGRMLCRVGLRFRENLKLPAASLAEGMVVAKDVFNEQGRLLLSAGTRLSLTSAIRLRKSLELKRPIEVATTT